MTSFAALHIPGQPFVMPNAWDIGSARLLAGLGAQAIGTTSAGYAQTRGVVDMGHIGRAEMIDHCAELAAAVNVPVSGDLEDGYGPKPEDCAETVRLAAQAGLAGLCIEDVAADVTAYARDHATDRMIAAAEAAKALGIFFVARADGVMHGLYDLSEALARVEAFCDAGADGIYVPMPSGPEADLTAVNAICAASTAPVNVLAAGPWTSTPLADFAAAGVARVSLGSALARTLMGVLDSVGSAALEGDFTALAHGMPFSRQTELLDKGTAKA